MKDKKDHVILKCENCGQLKYKKDPNLYKILGNKSKILRNIEYGYCKICSFRDKISSSHYDVLVLEDERYPPLNLDNGKIRLVNKITGAKIFRDYESIRKKGIVPDRKSKDKIDCGLSRYGKDYSTYKEWLRIRRLDNVQQEVRDSYNYFVMSVGKFKPFGYELVLRHKKLGYTNGNMKWKVKSRYKSVKKHLWFDLYYADNGYYPDWSREYKAINNPESKHHTVNYDDYRAYKRIKQKLSTVCDFVEFNKRVGNKPTSGNWRLYSDPVNDILEWIEVIK
jgi:uncharacterized protein YegJ (DUF2314 family)